MSSIRKRGNTVTAYWRKGDGSQGSKGGFSNTSEGRKAAAEHGQQQEIREHRLASGDLVEVDLRAPKAPPEKKAGLYTIAGYAPLFLKGHKLNGNTQGSYESALRIHILPVFGHMAFDDVTPTEVRAWLRELENKGTGYGLLRRIKSVASSMWEDAIQDTRTTGAADNPFLRLKVGGDKPPRRRALTYDEYERILKCLPAPWCTRVELVAETGMRIEEAMAIEPNDIGQNESGQWIIGITKTLNDQKTKGFRLKRRTKTGKPRMVAVTEHMARKLLALPVCAKGTLPKDPEWQGIFPPKKHATFRGGIWATAIRQAGIDWWPVPRDMRRSFATWLLEATGDIKKVSVALGHSNVAVTDGYIGDQVGADPTVVSAMEEYRAAQKAKKKRAA